MQSEQEREIEKDKTAEGTSHTLTHKHAEYSEKSNQIHKLLDTAQNVASRANDARAWHGIRRVAPSTLSNEMWITPWMVSGISCLKELKLLSGLSQIWTSSSLIYRWWGKQRMIELLNVIVLTRPLIVQLKRFVCNTLRCSHLCSLDSRNEKKINLLLRFIYIDIIWLSRIRGERATNAVLLCTLLRHTRSREILWSINCRQRSGTSLIQSMLPTEPQLTRISSSSSSSSRASGISFRLFSFPFPSLFRAE